MNVVALNNYKKLGWQESQRRREFKRTRDKFTDKVYRENNKEKIAEYNKKYQSGELEIQRQKDEEEVAQAIRNLDRRKAEIRQRQLEQEAKELDELE